MLLLFVLVLSAAQSSASWVGGGTLLRTNFTLPLSASRVASATAQVSGTGCYALFVNGRAALPTRLAPGFSTIPSERLLFETVELRSLLTEQPGSANVIEISLGMCKYGYMDNTNQGIYCVGAHGSTAVCRAAFFSMTVTFLAPSEPATDQQADLVIDTTDPTRWLATTKNNPIVYTHLYHGEVYDARKEQHDPQLWFTATAYNWTSNEQKGVGSLEESNIPPIGVDEEVLPASVTTVIGSDGNPAYVFDMGHNIAGVVELSDLTLPEGTRLVLRHSEILNKDSTVQNTYCSWPCAATCGQADGGNCANQTDVYIAGREGSRSTWSPLHTYHGFRYVQIEGWPTSRGKPSKQQVKGLFIHSLVKPSGNVYFKNKTLNILNRIQKAIQDTQLSNLHSIPTDCPQREKRGWLGDAQWTAGQAALNFDMESLYSNFVQSMHDTQDVGCSRPAGKPNPRRPSDYQCCNAAAPTFGCDATGTNFSSDTAGSLPDVVPYGKKTYGGWPGDPTWAIAPVIIPWEVHRRTGQTEIVDASYNTAKALTDFLTRHIDPAVGLVQFGYYGDWCSLENTPKGQVVSFSHILAVSRMLDMSKLLSKDADAATYATQLGRLKQVWHQVYYNESAGNYGESQTSNILALYLEIPQYNNVTVDKTVNALTGDIEAKGLALTSGALGTRYVFRVLQDYAPQMALSLATKTTEPSFGYMVVQGPGTIWETWTGDQFIAKGSKNHPMFTGGVGLYLYELAGIKHARWPFSFHITAAMANAIGGAKVQTRTLSVDWELKQQTSFTLIMHTKQELTRVHLPLLDDVCSGGAGRSLILAEHNRGFKQSFRCVGGHVELGDVEFMLSMKLSSNQLSFEVGPGSYSFEHTTGYQQLLSAN